MILKTSIFIFFLLPIIKERSNIDMLLTRTGSIYILVLVYNRCQSQELAKPLYLIASLKSWSQLVRTGPVIEMDERDIVIISGVLGYAGISFNTGRDIVGIQGARGRHMTDLGHQGLPECASSVVRSRSVNSDCELFLGGETSFLMSSALLGHIFSAIFVMMQNFPAMFSPRRRDEYDQIHAMKKSGDIFIKIIIAICI